MPRLTNHAYSATHQELHAAWVTDPTSIFLLNGIQQWTLHEYFRFSESLTETALLEHRRTVSIHDRSLPQRAGRAALHWRIKCQRLQLHRADGLVRPARTKGADYTLQTFAEIRPTIDIDQLATALVRALEDYVVAKKAGERNQQQ